jgi:hypothetical protein
VDFFNGPVLVVAIDQRGFVKMRRVL